LLKRGFFPPSRFQYPTSSFTVPQHLPCYFWEPPSLPMPGHSTKNQPKTTPQKPPPKKTPSKQTPTNPTPQPQNHQTPHTPHHKQPKKKQPPQQNQKTKTFFPPSLRPGTLPFCPLLAFWIVFPIFSPPILMRAPSLVTLTSNLLLSTIFHQVTSFQKLFSLVPGLLPQGRSCPVSPLMILATLSLPSRSQMPLFLLSPPVWFSFILVVPLPLVVPSCQENFPSFHRRLLSIPLVRSRTHGRPFGHQSMTDLPLLIAVEEGVPGNPWCPSSFPFFSIQFH